MHEYIVEQLYQPVINAVNIVLFQKMSISHPQKELEFHMVSGFLRDQNI